MSEEFEELPIHVIKLADGTTIIATFIEDDGQETLISNPMEMDVTPMDGKVEMFMQEWLYGCYSEEVIIPNDKIITHAPANKRLRKFYSKCIIQERLSDLVSELFNKELDNKSEYIDSLIDGLEPKDYTEDEDILSPWRNRMEWSPKSDTPIEDDEDESPF
jgi:hypothetical protein